MKAVYQFFRLIRFSNLVVIVLTMSFFYGLLSNYHLSRQYLSISDDVGFVAYAPTFLEKIGFADLNFILLMLSVVLIAASGNIINDYFDQKADRVNKPNRVIIDKFIKRRWAIILNWTFNAVGITLAFYLSWTLNNWWIVLISFGSINLLYFYSAVYKRKFLIGNFIVAFLTALVPLYVFIYGAYTQFGANSPFGMNDTTFIRDNTLPVIGYCGFAFLLNLVREIVKDLADIRGDLLLKSETLPIKIGIAKSRVVVAFLYLLILLPLALFIYFGFVNLRLVTLGAPQSAIFVYLIGAVFFCMTISLIIFYLKNKRKYYIRSANVIKIAMLFGVLSALFYV